MSEGKDDDAQLDLRTGGITAKPAAGGLDYETVISETGAPVVPEITHPTGSIKEWINQHTEADRQALLRFLKELPWSPPIG